MGLLDDDGDDVLILKASVWLTDKASSSSLVTWARIFMGYRLAITLLSSALKAGSGTARRTRAGPDTVRC